MSKATKKIIIVALALLITSVILFGFMVYQVTGQGALLTQQIDILEQQAAEEASYDQLQKLAEESAEQRQMLQSYFLDSDGNGIDLLNSIEATAPQAGVTLVTESVELVVDEGDSSEWIQATFSFSADRSRVQNFIKVLETLPHVSRITTVSLKSSSQSMWDAVVVIQVRVLDYDK